MATRIGPTGLNLYHLPASRVTKCPQNFRAGNPPMRPQVVGKSHYEIASGTFVVKVGPPPEFLPSTSTNL